MTELKDTHSSMDISLVMDSERELRSRIVQMRKLLYVAFGLGIASAVVLSVALPTLCAIVGSHKSRIDHLTRNEEQVIKMSTFEGSSSTKYSNTQDKVITVPEPPSFFTLYSRWGRIECPETAELVYKGVMAGAPYGNAGSGSNFLCLPDNPTYNFTVEGRQGERGTIYGTEYRLGDRLFKPLNDLHTHDVPCAICQAPRSVTLMMPADTECPSGWKKEYDGYLMSSKFDHKRGEYVCVDSNPTAIPGTKAVVPTSQVSMLYLVESRCSTSGGGLPCLPYKDNLELACAVCTR
ncbi:short-chain collagen C4-like [Anneissia japonica]|uniref:short-chain collagen C4-like n=1 Tax=Anneissia japonica TaxID=1529436 RepID=UPI0014254D7A|nr:short-chain collagen C4-like [Anneissia japonica]